MDFLIHFLRNAFELNEFEAKKASSLFEKKCFKKGTLIQSEGQNQGNLLIVETGIIREFYSIILFFIFQTFPVGLEIVCLALFCT